MARVLVRAHLYGALVIGIFVVALPAAAVRLDAALGTVSWMLVTPLGWALVATGAALSYGAFLVLVTRGQGTAFPTDPPRDFVVAGPYRWVRNPMYIGNLTMVFGLAGVLHSPGVLTYAVLLSLLTHWYVVTMEEPVLVARFGTSYTRYRGRVQRWLPRASPGAEDREPGSPPAH